MKRRNGFTVCELLIAAVVAAVVVGLAAGLLVHTARAASRGEQHLDARELATFAFAAVNEALTDANSYEISADGTSIAWETARQRGTLRFDRRAGRLELTTAAGRSTVATGLSGITITEQSPGLVRVELAVARPGAQPARAPIDVWMPAIASTDVETR